MKEKFYGEGIQNFLGSTAMQIPGMCTEMRNLSPQIFQASILQKDVEGVNVCPSL